MPTPAVAEGTSVSYLYGVVRSDQRPKLEDIVGVGGGRVSFVEEGVLTAVVGAVAAADLTPPQNGEQEAAWLEAAVRAHEYVLERSFEPGPVVPMRFATTLREEADVRALLRERETELVASLERLAGTREWGVKGSLRDPAALARRVREARGDLVAEERELDGRSSGASYFARKRLDQELTLAGDALVAESVRLAHELLAAAAVDARLTATRQPRSKRIWLNGAYLVAETEDEAFRAQVVELDRDHAEFGVRYELTGPWPAYNFVGDEAQ
jgi:Gas vesicle synthesis protein GvpL/GvpF